MSDDVRMLEPVVAPLAAIEASALIQDEEVVAERRVQRAKQRLTERLAALDLRARSVARQSVWVAGAVLLGLAGAGIASLLARRESRRGYGYPRADKGPGVGTALMLAALGLVSRRIKRWQPRLAARTNFETR